MSGEYNLKKYYINGVPLYVYQYPVKNVSSLIFVSKFGFLSEKFLNLKSETFHLLEHLLFVESKKIKDRKKISEIFENGGVVNGFTDFDFTAMVFSSLNDNFLEKLDLFFDCLTYLSYSENNVEMEKKIIESELRGILENPEEYLCYVSPLSVFSEDSAVSFFSDIRKGIREIREIDKDKILEVKQKYLLSKESFFILCGDINEKILSTVKKYIENIDFYESKIDFDVKREIKYRKIKEYREDINSCYLAVSWVIDGRKFVLNNKEKINLLEFYLTGGLDSMILKALREELNACYSAYTIHIIVNNDVSVLSIVVPNINPEKYELAKEKLFEILEDLREEKFNNKLLERVRRKLIYRELVRKIEVDPYFVSERMADLILAGIEESYHQYIEKLKRKILEEKLEIISDIIPKKVGIIEVLPKSLF